LPTGPFSAALPSWFLVSHFGWRFLIGDGEKEAGRFFFFFDAFPAPSFCGYVTSSTTSPDRSCFSPHGHVVPQRLQHYGLAVWTLPRRSTKLSPPLFFGPFSDVNTLRETRESFLPDPVNPLFLSSLQERLHSLDPTRDCPSRTPPKRELFTFFFPRRFFPRAPPSLYPSLSKTLFGAIGGAPETLCHSLNIAVSSPPHQLVVLRKETLEEYKASSIAFFFLYFLFFPPRSTLDRSLPF